MEILFRYYPLAFIAIGCIARENQVRTAALLLGLHIMVAPFMQKAGSFDFFSFYAVWDLAAIVYCLFLEGHWRKIALVLICSISFYINAYNQLFFNVDGLIIYTYYTQINTALLECMLAIIASYAQGRIRQLMIFCAISTLFIWLRM
jgi:hypothetical protein